MTIDAEAVIDREAVERILKKVQLDHNIHINRNIDRDKMIRGRLITEDDVFARLSEIKSHHRIRSIQRTARAERRALVKKAVIAARRLIKENERILAVAEALAPAPQPHSAALQRMIADWIAASDLSPSEVTKLLGRGTMKTAEGKEWVPASDGLPYSFGKGFSAFEETVHRLRVIFELFFNQPAKCTKVGSRYKGAFIDFSEAALEEMGITNGGKPFSRSSIADALRTLDHGRRNR